MSGETVINCTSYNPGVKRVLKEIHGEDLRIKHPDCSKSNIRGVLNLVESCASKGEFCYLSEGCVPHEAYFATAGPFRVILFGPRVLHSTYSDVAAIIECNNHKIELIWKSNWVLEELLGSDSTFLRGLVTTALG